MSRLFDQLIDMGATDEEVEELYKELQFVFENPFDGAINEAIALRQCAYIEPMEKTLQ